MNFPENITAAFTGYRPAKIKLSSSNPFIEKEIRQALGRVVRELYDRGYRIFLDGMAEGFDLWAAEEVISLRERGVCPDAGLVAVIPHRGQPAKFPPESKVSYERVLASSSQTIILSEHYYPECYLVRNDYLVDNSSLLVTYFDGQPGGTKYTVGRGWKKGIPVINLLDPSLLLF